MALSRDEILGKKAGKVHKFTHPDGSGDVFLRVISSKERDFWEQGCFGNSKKGQPVSVRSKLVALVLVDESGKRLFTDAESVLIDGLESSFVDPLFDEAMRVNRMRKEDVDDLEKNSETVPTSA